MESVNFIELKLFKNLCRIAFSNLFAFSLMFLLGYNPGESIRFGVLIALLSVSLVSIVHIIGLKFGFLTSSDWMSFQPQDSSGKFSIWRHLLIPLTNFIAPPIFTLVILVLLVIANSLILHGYGALVSILLIILVCVLYWYESLQSNLVAGRLYLEFTLLFFLFPLFIACFVWLVPVVTEEEKNLEVFSKIFNLLSPIVLSLVIIWIFSTLVIQGSETVIKRSGFKGEACRDAVFHYIYKHNLQVRCVFLFSLIVVALQGIFSGFNYMSTVFGVLGVGIFVSSISELFLIKKLNSIRIRDGIESLKGLIEFDSLGGNFENSICVSPQPGESKRCVAEKIGYLKCENCKKLTSD